MHPVLRKLWEVQGVPGAARLGLQPHIPPRPPSTALQCFTLGKTCEIPLLNKGLIKKVPIKISPIRKSHKDISPAGWLQLGKEKGIYPYGPTPRSSAAPKIHAGGVPSISTFL